MQFYVNQKHPPLSTALLSRIIISACATAVEEADESEVVSTVVSTVLSCVSEVDNGASDVDGDVEVSVVSAVSAVVLETLSKRFRTLFGVAEAEAMSMVRGEPVRLPA